MTRERRLIMRSLLAVVVGFGLGAGSLVIGARPAKAAKDVNAATDQFRSGGCSGCFFTQTEAILANFSQVTRVFRGCATGPNINPGQFSTDECGGPADVGGKSALLDFFVIQGNLKDSNTDPDGLGVPGGATDVTYRVSSTGSFRGIRCANNANPGTLGYLAPEGLDGIPNTSDDAGIGVNQFGVPGVPAGWPDLTATNRAPLVSCTTTATGGTHIADFAKDLPAAEKPDFSGMTELCVVNYDADGNADINNKSDGVTPGTYASIAAVSPGNETTNLALTCDMGFADLPTADFQDAKFNSQTFSNQSTVGAEIFKIVANNDVHPANDPSGNAKLTLQMPQIQALFGGTSLGIDACSWKAVGATVTGDATGQIKVCFRENGSGSRETFRNSFMREPEGSHIQGATVGTFTCNARNEGSGGTSTPKVFQQNDTNSDEAGCVSDTTATGEVGYVDAARSSASMYSVPVFGVDPDTNDLRTMVKCGMWPYWGPLTGGTGLHAGATPLSNPYVVAHLAALRNGVVFGPSEDYLPLGGIQTGVAFTKDLTASFYKLKFTPNNCPGTINPPALHP